MLHDRYEIVDTLGEGGFGKTYTARDSSEPDRPLLVVKEIRFPESNDPRVLEMARRRFEREASALQRLGTNSCIPEFFDRFEENNCFYLVQELIVGHQLRQEITPNMQWTEKQTVDFLLEVLEILQFVHGEGIVHRDITPANLMRCEANGQIVLIDFGTVREISTFTANSTGEILTSQEIGTSGYMPAEQYDTRYNPQPYNDIYAVGIIAIQALTARNPNTLRADHDTGELIWHYSMPDRPLIQISDGLKAILNNMVRYNFKDRYQSVTDILQQLHTLEDSNSIAILDPPQEPQDSDRAEQNDNNYRTSEPQPPEGNWLARSPFLLLAIPGIIAGGAIALFLNIVLTPQTCPLVQGDALSCGEESLLETSIPRIKQRGVNEFTKANYREAFNLFKSSWKEEERRDPETLIYMNNAWLRAQKVDYDTIAVSIPVRKNEQGRVDIDLAKEILRGVAQAQTKVNLKLLNSEIDRDLNGLDVRENRVIKAKGLQVIIADDSNQKEQAIARANSLVKLGGVLGAIGPYTNEMTVSAVDIYDRNKLVLISPGSTTQELTDNPRKFFFRTVPRTKVTVEVFTKYLMEKQGQTTVAGFYNTKTEASSSLWEEFRKQFRERGGKIAKITEYDLSQSDFNVAKALQEIGQTDKTTIVVSPGHHLNAFNNAMALFQANSGKNWFVGTGGIYGQKTLEAAAKLPSFEKLLVAVSWHYLKSPNPKFLEDTHKLWEGNVSHRTALTYDAAATLIEAIEKQQHPSREGMQKIIADPNFSAFGATGKIEFDTTTGDRKNFSPLLVHIVKCSKERFGLTFVPVEFPTAAAAGLKCD